ncbi:hypothetical protein F53441_11917 [Fusarium austroafricanum]|uniref:Uncharacterized protein n=1 Tax=Fusarium austroafricanum TaxID=2364996 RepID=A0A8H4JZE3_9HYPO|nr:hypothetical protein F53441_11917 [Fusarium austroafricanum]
MPEEFIEMGDLSSLPPAAKARGDRARARTKNGDQSNFPSRDISHLIYGDQPGKKHRLWITDRIMEPQIIPHFLEFAQNGFLPNDQQTWRPLLTFEEVKNLMRPSSEWAPAPHNRQARSTGEWIGIRIGSYEDSSRLWRISKELHAMKSRLWEGLPPLSERRWQELGLDHPQNFPTACRYFVAVNDVFTYLNNKRTKAALRTTYNLIWDHLSVFEKAVNAKRKAEAEDGVYREVSVTALWYEYTKAQYESISENAHHWLMEHIERIRESLVQQIAYHQPKDTEDHYDDTQWEIIWKIHDLGKNSAQADYSIFLPMDGYKGGSLSIAENDPLTTAHKTRICKLPISWSANLEWRAADYDSRFMWLFVSDLMETYMREQFDESARQNDPAKALILNITQIDAQGRARQELRGPPRPTEVIPWIEYARRASYRHLSFVAYRLCHTYKPEKWDTFKTKFEADISDWGRGKVDINDIRKACKIQWIDGKEHDMEDDDIEAAKKHFQTISDQSVHQRVFLAIDEATMKSYLEPTPGKANFVLAIDTTYEGSDERASESPGYKGTLRILGSLLWDELGAMLVMQSALPRDLWPMALDDPERVYRGPKVAPVLKFSTYEEILRWKLASEIVPDLVEIKRALDTGENRHRQDDIDDDFYS